MRTKTLTPELLHKIDAYWRAANYLSVGQIYLYDNPLLKKPLELAHIKPRLVGHWGTTPGLNFIYVHLNRVVQQHELDVNPGHLTHAPGNGAPIGGLKVVSESGCFAARPSGNEDIYRVCAESFRGVDCLGRILEEAQAIVSDALAVPDPREKS